MAGFPYETTYQMRGITAVVVPLHISVHNVIFGANHDCSCAAMRNRDEVPGITQP